jgi:hypothetical protein
MIPVYLFVVCVGILFLGSAILKGIRKERHFQARESSRTYRTLSIQDEEVRHERSTF